METKQIIAELRQRNCLTQDEFASKLYVTRQAVSRWETGETVPNTDALKLISKTFGVSINTLLGEPHNTVCQVCGSALDALGGGFGREADGTVNDQYCKYCYIDGVHKYVNIDDVISDVAKHSGGAPERIREYLLKQLPALEYWKSVSE